MRSPLSQNALQKGAFPEGSREIAKPAVASSTGSGTASTRLISSCSQMLHHLGVALATSTGMKTVDVITSRQRVARFVSRLLAGSSAKITFGRFTSAGR